MFPLFIERLFSPEAIQALSWTLIHSLWQGMILAVLAAIAITITKRSSSALRYNLLSGLFFVFLLGAVITFIREWSLQTGTVAVSAANVTDMAVTNIAWVSGPEAPASGGAEGLFLKVIDYLSVNASMIVTIWFIIFCFRFVRLLSEIGYVQRIKHYKTQEPAAYWKERVQELAEVMQIRKVVALVESHLVKVPSVVGLLKPVILVPVGLLAQLPAAEVEAILLHELAHIRRKDFFVNLVQRFAESIFFFNPAVLWISSMIKEERENCCDDLAVAAGESKKDYINALVNFHQFNLDRGTLQAAMGFPGHKSTLLGRVKRMVTSENKKLNPLEKLVVLCLLLTISLLPLLAAPNVQAQQSPTGQQPQAVHRNDSITPGNTNAAMKTQVPYPDLSSPPTEEELYLTTVTTNDNDGNRYKLVMVGDRPPVFYVNDETVTKEKQLRKYTDLIDRLKKELWKRKGAADAKKKAQTGSEASAQQQVNKIVDDLVRDRIIDQKGSLTSFRLSGNEFLVNGQKQAFDVYNRYKGKYLRDADQSFAYNYP